jgi:hypothetical protein
MNSFYRFLGHGDVFEHMAFVPPVSNPCHSARSRAFGSREGIAAQDGEAFVRAAHGSGNSAEILGANEFARMPARSRECGVAEELLNQMRFSRRLRVNSRASEAQLLESRAGSVSPRNVTEKLAARERGGKSDEEDFGCRR